MVRSLALMVPAALALASATGCMTGKPLQAESVNKALQDALPTAKPKPAPAVVAEATPQSLNAKAASPHQAATEFITVWRSQLGNLPDPTQSGAMKPGLVGQVFIMNDKHLPADVTGTLTIAATDATDRPPGQAARQPNAWHFDNETLKRMRVVDDRFGKCVAVFLPWPDEWVDVNRLQIQARYDQPGAGTYTLYAPQSVVTLDFITNGSQVNVSQGRFTANAMSVPDPKVMMQQAKVNGGRGPAAAQPNGPITTVPPPSDPVFQAGFQQQPAWPTNAGRPMGQSFSGTTPPQPNMTPPMTGMSMPIQGLNQQPGMTPPPTFSQPQGGSPNGAGDKDVRFVIPRN